MKIPFFFFFEEYCIGLHKTSEVILCQSFHVIPIEAGAPCPMCCNYDNFLTEADVAKTETKKTDQEVLKLPLFIL